MKASFSIHDVTAIRVKGPQPLNGGTHWRDVEIETTDGDVFVLTTFTTGERADIEVDEQTDVPERHLEAG